MTDAEKLREEGIDRGIEPGIDKGRILDKQTVLAHLIERKFGITQVQRESIESTTDAGKLDAALEKLLFAEGGDEVLGCL